MTNLEDRRVQKTRQILQKAILGLIVEKEYESITVQNILDRANVGRSTFYTHYQDKGELLHSCFDEFHKLLEQHTLSISKGSPSPIDLESNLDFTLKLLKFAERNCQLFKALLKQQDLSESIQDSLFGYFHEPFEIWMARNINSSVPSEIVTRYFINAFFGTFKWWVCNDMPYTAEEIDRYFKLLAMPTIKSITLAD
jgi:AcrR family transcriptional regulator